jgi:hypothetical protein
MKQKRIPYLLVRHLYPVLKLFIQYDKKVLWMNLIPTTKVFMMTSTTKAKRHVTQSGTSTSASHGIWRNIITTTNNKKLVYLIPHWQQKKPLELGTITMKNFSLSITTLSFSITMKNFSLSITTLSFSRRLILIHPKKPGPSLRIQRLGSGNEKRPVIKSKHIFFF